MRVLCRSLNVGAMLGLVVGASTTGAQDSVRVLRFQPDSVASPVAPVVITFDRALAPKLDQSLDPRSVLRISPRRDMVVRWRDPSTIVAEFGSAWTPGASYEISLSPEFRVAAGRPVARIAPWTVRVQRARLLQFGGPPERQVSPVPVDTVPVVYAVYSGAVTADQFVGRARVWGLERCERRDTLALEVVSIAKLSADSPEWLRDAGAYDRDRRLDSLRHVITLRSPGKFPRHCRVEVTTPTEAGAAPTTSLYLEVREPLSVSILTRGEEQATPCSSGCSGGPLTLAFSRPVRGSEIRRAVRVDGHPPGVSGDAPQYEWPLRDSVPMGRGVRLRIEHLTGPDGDRLERTIDTLLQRNERAVELGYVNGEIHVPRSSNRLLRVRVAYADSLAVVIARVPDSLRGRALMHGDSEFGRIAEWEDVASDSVVRIMPVVSSATEERIVDVDTSYVPAAWRGDPLLVVHAVPINRPRVPREPQSSSPRPRGTGIRDLPPVDVTASAYGAVRQPMFALVQRTDLTAHAAQRGRTLVIWVTKRASAQPVAGARVRVFRGAQRVIASAASDSLGLVEIRLGERDWAGSGEGSHYVEVSSGDDRLLLALPQEMWMRGAEPRRVSDAPSDGLIERMHGVAFTDRAIYRPGERVYLKGIARAYRGSAGYVTPAGDSARWTISFLSAPGEQLHVHTGRLGTFGTFVDSFQVASTARVGHFYAAFEVRRRDGWKSVAECYFQVAEYRVPEFTVTLSRDTAVRVYGGDTASIRVAARYLFGPLMAGAKVTSRVSVTPTEDEASEIEALRQFSVGRPTYWRARDPSSQYAQYEQTGELDASGTATLRLPVPRNSSPGRMAVDVSVQDVNRQSIASTMVVPVREASVHVGLRVPQRRWLWTTRDSIPVDILVAARTGVIRSDLPVTITGLRYTWQSTEWRPDTVWRSEARSGKVPASALFAPQVAGWYEIVASVRDEQGRATESAVTLYVWDSGNDAARSATRFTVRTERHRYQVGDSAVVFIDAPSDLSAIVTLRREFFVEKRAAALRRGANAVRIAVPVTAIGGAVIDVVAARPLGAEDMVRGSGQDHFRESVEIAVSDSVRALRVRLLPERTRYAPGDSVRISLEVRDATGRGRRSEAAVWAVDEGVLSLTGYRVPDVLSLLVARPYEWERTSSTLRSLLMAEPPSVGPVYYWKQARGSLTGAALSLADAGGGGFFGGGVRPADPVRHRFVTTPFYAGTVVTDSTGRATLAFVLPHNTTTYRLFAAAVGDDDIWAGAGDTTIVSTRPLVVRPALPRAVRRGDSLYAGAVLVREGRNDSTTQVTLTMRANGARIDGPFSVRDTLTFGRARERRFAMRVDAEDSVTVGFAASAPDADDAVVLRLPVAPPGRPRAHVAMGTLRGESTAEVDLPEGIDLARSRLVLQSGHSPLPLLRELDERLRVYPYACTEQLASAARALVARARLERTLGYRSTLAPEDRARLEIAVGALLDRQRDDGAFGYWSRTHWSTPWLTTHVLDALLGARELGVSVPQSALDRATKYFAADTAMGELVRDMLRQRWLAAGDSIWWPHEALSAARLLREIGRPDTALERKVWLLRSRLDFQNRLVLARLRAATGDSVQARGLVDDAWRSVRYEGRRVVVEDSVLRRSWLFRSVTGAYTELLRATVALRPTHPGLGPLLESLLQSARSDAGRWNTVDVSTLAEAIESTVAPLAMTSGTRLSVSDAHGVSSIRDLVPSSADSLALDPTRYVVGDGARRRVRVRLASSSSAPVYYALTLFEVPVVRPVRPDQEGIAIERWYERYEDGKPITDVREGELVRVRLRITAPRDREFVVIDDPLPAGLEAVDQSLRTTGSLPPYVGAPKLEGDSREGPIGQKWLYGSWDAGWWTPWEHKEIRDDRVLWFARQLWRGSYQASYVARATTAGLFIRPPAQAEEMYNPAVHGRSEGGVFSIRSADQPAPNR